MDYKPAFFSLEQMLVVISGFYKAGTALRLYMYQTGLLKSRQLPCFVISIGNIVAGGAGKTPMAIYIAELVKKMGKKPVVISRGYKGRLKNRIKVVGDAETVFLSSDTAGDEPCMMARRKTFPVVAGKDRYKAGMLAVRELNPDVIILDDGFQHLKVKRDMNILLFDHNRPLGNKRMLPAGRLRETPAMSKKPVHAVIFTRSPEKTDGGVTAGDKQAFDLMRLYPETPYFKSFHSPTLFKFIPSQNSSHDNSSIKNRITNLSILKDRKAVLFSGIANNSAFAEEVHKLGCSILAHLEFKDHFRYKSSDIQMIQKKIEGLKADMVVTTEKDWVKLGRGVEWSADMAVLGININFQDPSGFESLLNTHINS